MADDGRWCVTRPLTYVERRDLDRGIPLSQPVKKADEGKPTQDKNRFQGSAGWLAGHPDPSQKPK